jgi:hypothetical protein
MPPSSFNAYCLRIELKDFKPAIYREVLVDPNITLRKLHAVIQAAMGWGNSHLYAFAQPLSAADTFWKTLNTRKWQRPDPEGWGDSLGDDSKVKLSQLLTAQHPKLIYLYDFGDEWLHTITLMDFCQANLPLPHLQKAQNGCPPEDCGGPPGAEHWSAAWYDASHEDHETAREMFGGQEPGSLDFEALKKAVVKLQKKPSPRAK